MKQFIFILILFTNSVFIAQTENKDKNIFQKYNDFLTIKDEDKTSFIMFGVQYAKVFNVKTITTSGTHISFGLNTARFVSNKFLLGISFDFRLTKGFSSKRIEKTFKNDYLNNFSPTYESSSDSVITHILYEALNGNKKHNFRGMYLGNMGISFSPFPNKYGGFLIEVKKGYRTFPMHYSYDSSDSTLNNGTRDWLDLDISEVLSVELKFKPLTFFKDDKFKLPLYPNLIVSLYYERFDFSKAKIKGVYLDKMVTEEFTNKYKIEHRFGIKIGIGIY